MKRLLLMKSRQEEVCRVIEEAGLDVSEFRWGQVEMERVPMGADAAAVSVLLHEPTGYQFVFDMRSESFWGTYSPGDEVPEEFRECQSWGQMVDLVAGWAVNLRREIEAGGVPDGTAGSAPDRMAAASLMIASTDEEEGEPRKGKIFIGHGRSRVWKDLKDFLRDRLGLEWDEFNREATAGLSTKERLQIMLDNACFAFLVMTAEDEHPDGTKHARGNVIHEVGLFQGRLGFKKAIILLEGNCAEFSNITGLTQIRFPTGDIKAKFEEIRQVLERERIPGLGENLTLRKTSNEQPGKPVLRLSFDRDSEDCIYSYGGDYYISVLVTNEGDTARNFIAHLTQMHQMHPGVLSRVPIHGPHNLVWAHRKRDIELVHHESTPLNVLVASNPTSPLKVQLQGAMPRAIEEACATFGEYVFTILVAADGAEQQEIRLRIRWDGRWNGKWTKDDIDVYDSPATA